MYSSLSDFWVFWPSGINLPYMNYHNISVPI
jgi:hypothetical protein